MQVGSVHELQIGRGLIYNSLDGNDEVELLLWRVRGALITIAKVDLPEAGPSHLQIPSQW